MSEGMKEEFKSLSDQDWEELIQYCLKKQPQIFKQKDIIILRLYLTFMGKDLKSIQDDASFLETFALLVRDLGSSSSY